MISESTPVQPDKLAIRLIWKDFFKSAAPVPIQASAFAPRPNENAGISMFRLIFLNDPKDVLLAIAQEKRASYVIAAVPVSDLLRLNLTVVSDPIPTVAGHVVIPELNYPSLIANRQRMRSLQVTLATLASQHVIHNPLP